MYASTHQCAFIFCFFRERSYGDAVTDYEIMRAEMVADELGYVGFAADSYGTITDDSTMIASHIQAAVDLVRTFEEVDPENVAIIGYGAGGTGVLTYALTGVNDVQAVVSFHAGLDTLPEAGPAITPKVLVLSGAEDATSFEIVDLEKTLDNATATWEITRYWGIDDAFTVFNDTGYSEWADMRSWDSMREFLAECFGEKVYESSPPNTTMVEAVPYTDVDGTELQSYIALPDEGWQRPFPAVVILPDWDGNNEYEKQRATLLAELGYGMFMLLCLNS